MMRGEQGGEMMGRTLDEVIAAFAEERRDRIEARFMELKGEAESPAKSAARRRCGTKPAGAG
jgi:hypothetical protein